MGVVTVLGVAAGGLVDMWGQVRGPAWTNLDGNVASGATTIIVAEDVGWYVFKQNPAKFRDEIPLTAKKIFRQVGDKLVIASTDLEYADAPQSEARTITAINGR